MRRAIPLVLAALTLAACGDIGMDRQAKVVDQGPGAPATRPPAGTVAQGAPARNAAALAPPPISLALVERGRERHAIACAPCHGATGEGAGSVVLRGYPAPPAYGDAAVRALSGRQVYDVITDGYGVMAPQAERLAPADRWAVVAYIRALQLRPAPKPEPRA